MKPNLWIDERKIITNTTRKRESEKEKER